jgi:DnaJ-class molecular chaperone
LFCPDRHAHATKEEQKEEEKKFKELGEAYSVLSDSKKRMRYDNGQDLEEMNDGSGFGGMCFTLILCTVFWNYMFTFRAYLKYSVSVVVVFL